MREPHPSVSIVIPVLDEAAGIADALRALVSLRERGAQVVIVDGGSRDGTRELAAPLADLVIEAPRGRASQMNAGARAAAGDILVFLHADTRLPAGALEAIGSGLDRTGRTWGRFDVEIAGRGAMLAVVAAMMNARSRLTGIATGDQAIFCTRSAFAAAGSYPFIPLMEDIVFSRRLKQIALPIALKARVLTSGRRWQKHGVLRTILRMWSLRLAFFVGVDAEHLAKWYGHARHNS